MRESGRMAFDGRGITLIDTLVGIALMIVVFIGIVGAFELGVDVVENNKARAGAIALADERMEYVRSLTYSSIGTLGGIPAGSIAQSETVSLNNITYTRRTVIEYVDDPKDGTGGSDANGVTEDYKSVKVDVAWSTKRGTRDIEFVGRFSPTNGLETNPCASSCGTLTVNAVNAAGTALSGASVSITNASTSPPVSINTFTNASGTVSLAGAPAATGYQIIVSKSGYSTAQTYNATAQNTNPSPSNLTVSNNQTTSGTFAIDLYGAKTVNTYLWANGQSATSVPNVAFTLQGAKTIGSGPGGTLYKYSTSQNTGSSGSVTISNLEWDSYTVSIDGSATGYDIASACNPQPESLSPAASMTSKFYLTTHTANSLLVDVRGQSSGTLITGAYVLLTRNGFSSGTSTDPCGQSFFSALTSANNYTVAVGAPGHATSTTRSVNVSGTTRLSVQLN